MKPTVINSPEEKRIIKECPRWDFLFLSKDELLRECPSLKGMASVVFDPDWFAILKDSKKLKKPDYPYIVEWATSSYTIPEFISMLHGLEKEYDESYVQPTSRGRKTR